jgi:hypothetical protein
MVYLIYSTGWKKHYNTLYPFLRVDTINEAVNCMRELLQEGRAVKIFSHSINVEQYKVTNYKNKRIIRRK